MRNPMLDEDFLHQLDSYPHHNIWAKIISLNYNEYPLEEISGRVSNGTINIDGNSSVRRTCSLTLLSKDVDIHDFFWGLKTKFKLYIGIENHINNAYIDEKKRTIQESINLLQRKILEMQDEEEKLEALSRLGYLENKLTTVDTDYAYPDIIWFNQGVFIVSSFSCTAAVNNYTIQIQGKDKMTLLNGDLGGVIPATWDFATLDQNVSDDEGQSVYDDSGYALVENVRIPIKDIILQAVHEFAQESWTNIIVNDLDDYGIEMLEYQGTVPLYYIISEPSSYTGSKEVVNMTLNGNMECEVMLADWVDGNLVEYPDRWISGQKLGNLELSDISDAARAAGAMNPPAYSYESLIDDIVEDNSSIDSYNYYRTKVRFASKEQDGSITYSGPYTIAKITRDNGLQVCGYRISDIIYPYDLIAAPGETVTSVLDKLVNMLGNFEYFYDVEGHFIFQKKRTYLDVSYNNLMNEHSIKETTWANNGEFSNKYSYVFDSNVLVSSIQNAPNIAELKNDFSLWGARTNGNVTIPIHLRYAIDKKPLYYKTIDGREYISKEGVKEYNRLTNSSIGNSSMNSNSGVSSVEKIRNIVRRSDYPAGLDSNWWKLEDWFFLYALAKEKSLHPTMSYAEIVELDERENILEQHKSDQRMHNILNYNEYQTGAELSTVFWPGFSTLVNAGIVAVNNRTIDETAMLEKGYTREEIEGMKKEYNAHSYSFVNNRKYNVIDVSNTLYEGRHVATNNPHGNGCSHSYAQLVGEQIQYNSTVYIYNPGLNISNNTVSEDLLKEIDTVLKDLMTDNVNIVDWRELIFQMANDYRRYYRDDDFLLKIKENNMYSDYDSWYPSGYTGYENYYIDFEMNASQGSVAYWRELYNPDMINSDGLTHIGRYKVDGTFDYDANVEKYNPQKTYNKNDRAYIEEGEEGHKTKVIYRSLKNGNTNMPKSTSISWAKSQGEFQYNSEGWNTNIINNPEVLNFWFDFLDTTGEMNKYSVHNIGLRSKAVNDDKIKAIYFREVPNVIFELGDDYNQFNLAKKYKKDVIVYDYNENRVKEYYKSLVNNNIGNPLDDTSHWIKYNNVEPRKSGYSYVKIPTALNDLFYISSRGKNSLDVLEEYLYNYTYPISSITLTTVPIYYLTPNTLIYVNDPDTGTIGEYILNRYSIQFGLGSQMSITAVETSKRLY